jgi:hypothetical protein
MFHPGGTVSYKFFFIDPQADTEMACDRLSFLNLLSVILHTLAPPHHEMVFLQERR